MKYLKTITLLIAIAITVYSCTRAEASKVEEASNPGDIEMLNELGFNNTENVVSSEKFTLKQYYGEMNLKFIHDVELKTILETDNLYLGPVEKFIGKIPEKNVNEIIKNALAYKNKTNFVKTYITPDNRAFTESEFNKLDEDAKSWILRRGKVNDKPVYLIAAPPDQFDLGSTFIENRTVKEKPLDPIALIKVDKGYVELSRWLN